MSLRPSQVVPPLQWLGKVSYSLYIVHTMVGWVVIHFGMPYFGRDGGIVVAFAVALVVAWATYTLGEKRGSRALKALLLRLRAWLDRMRVGAQRSGD